MDADKQTCMAERDTARDYLHPSYSITHVFEIPSSSRIVSPQATELLVISPSFSALDSALQTSEPLSLMVSKTFSPPKARKFV